MRELYLESYYNGSRLGMSWRKFIGYIKRKKINHDNFSPITTLNLSPSKKGIISISLFGDDKSDRFWSGLVEPILQTRKKYRWISSGMGCESVYLLENFAKGLSSTT